MGFWDAGIGDLEAMGISVSDDAIDVMEGGGQVLVVKGLLSPYHWYGDESGMWDQEGVQVFTPVLMDVVSPMATELPAWQIHDTPIRSFMDDQSGDTMWRSWPSYIGDISEEAIDSPYSGEGLFYARAWDGTPLVSATDRMLAHEIIVAARKRISDSAYEPFCILSGFEADGEYSVDDLDPLLEFTADQIRDIHEFDGYDPDYLMCVLQAYKDLVKDGYLSVEGVTREVVFKPMSHYLDWLPEANFMWERMVNRHENALTIIHSSLSDKAATQFRIYEGQVS
jgi:hypothetical protein